MRKGRPLLVEGRVTLDQWDDKQTGQKRSKLVSSTIQFLSAVPRRGRGGATARAAPLQRLHRRAAEPRKPTLRRTRRRRSVLIFPQSRLNDQQLERSHENRSYSHQQHRRPRASPIRSRSPPVTPGTTSFRNASPSRSATRTNAAWKCCASAAATAKRMSSTP